MEANLQYLAISNRDLSNSNKSLTDTIAAISRAASIDSILTGTRSPAPVTSAANTQETPQNLRVTSLIAIPSVDLPPVRPRKAVPSTQATYHLQRCMESVQELARTNTSALEALHGQQQNGSSDIHGSYERLATDLKQLPPGVQCVHCARSVAWPQLQSAKLGIGQVGACICMSQTSPYLWKLCDYPTGEGARQRNCPVGNSGDVCAGSDDPCDRGHRAALPAAEPLDPVVGGSWSHRVPACSPGPWPSGYGNTTWIDHYAVHGDVRFAIADVQSSGQSPQIHNAAAPFIPDDEPDTVALKRVRNTTAARESHDSNFKERDAHERAASVVERSATRRDVDHDQDSLTSPLHDRRKITTIPPEDTATTTDSCDSDDYYTKRSTNRKSHLNPTALAKSSSMRQGQRQRQSKEQRQVSSYARIRSGRDCAERLRREMPIAGAECTSVDLQRDHRLGNVQQQKEQQQQQRQRQQLHMNTPFGDRANFLNDESLDLDMNVADVGAEGVNDFDNSDFHSFLDPNDGGMAPDFPYRS